jgi:hypothetical protein
MECSHDLPQIISANGKLVKSAWEGEADVKKRFTEEQILGFLKQAEAGVPIAELCR